jgi:phosphoglycolate phosphatase-like HAD superfamily hydrolase
MDTNELWHVIQNQIETIKKETDASHHPALERACDSIKQAIDKFFGEQVAMGLPHPHPRSRIYRSEPKTWDIRESSSSEIFNLILDKAKKSKRTPACIFDLDGTLFDVGYRTIGILKEWLSSDASSKFDKSLIQKIAKINYSHVGYSLSHLFENSGFDLRNQEIMSLFSSVEKAWKKKFFDGVTLVKYDQAMKNSSSFVNLIHNNKIEIFYLTGRYEHSMHNGTLEQLNKFKYPYFENNLILKANPFADDQLFKAEQVRKISERFDVVGNFENEYLNIAYMALEIKDAINVIVDSQHSGRPTPTLDMPIYRISRFEETH